MNLIQNFRYRPEIDGLRAIAVMVVVLYHAGFGCPGGFVGVDIFFVISGYLITSLIWKDLENGTFRFANFWERRARRIVPALVVVTLISLITGWFLLLPSDYANLGKASASQSVFFANFHYWLDSGYFSEAAEEKPLLHTWSLAVEEQFYLIVPFLLWGILGFWRYSLTRSTLLSLLIVGCVLSHALSIYGVIHHPVAAFYLLPTRAWELLSGSIVAFLPYSKVIHSRRSICEMGSLFGMSLILFSVFFYTSETPFPGLAAVAPVLGTSLLIWSNFREQGGAITLIGRVLSIAPFTFIGLISYSLYLWHWPLLAFSKYWFLEPLTFGYRIGMVILGLILAYVSWRFVETPFRTRRLGLKRKSIFVYASAGLTIVFVSGVCCVIQKGFLWRFSPDAQRYANAAKNGSDINIELADVKRGKLPLIGAPADADQAPSIMIWGDSHAMAIVPAVDLLLKQKGLVGVVATHYSTAPILDWYKVEKHGLNQQAPAFNQAVFSYLKNHDVKHVVLAGLWCSYCPINQGGKNTESSAASFSSALLLTISKLVESGIQPWLLLDVPNHTIDVPKALSRSTMSEVDLIQFFPNPSNCVGLDEIAPKTIMEIEALGCYVLDPKPAFLSDDAKYYIMEKDGVALYSDSQHLTQKGAELILFPFFREHLYPLRKDEK